MLRKLTILAAFAAFVGVTTIPTGADAWGRGGGWHGGGWGMGGWHSGWRRGWRDGWHGGWLRGYGWGYPVYGGYYGLGYSPYDESYNSYADDNCWRWDYGRWIWMCRGG